MSNNIVQFNEEIIKGQIKELVRGSVEETLNELLEADDRTRFRVFDCMGFYAGQLRKSPTAAVIRQPTNMTPPVRQPRLPARMRRVQSLPMCPIPMMPLTT